MRIIMIVIALITNSLATNLFYKTIEKINIFDNRPKWVKLIDKNQLIQKNGYQCYQLKISANSYNEGKQLIESNIKKQILSSIVTYINSNLNITKKINNNEYYRNISNNLDVSSFGKITDVYLKHYFYDEGNQVAYGYICINNNQYIKLKNLNKKRIKRFIILYRKFNYYINTNDKEGALNTLQQIQIEFPEYSNTKYFHKMQEKINKILNYNIKIPKTVNIGDALYCSIFTDKTIYLNVIKNDNLLLLSDKIIEANKITKLKLIPYINNTKIKLTFYLSYTPLNLQMFTLNNKLSQNYLEHILNYQLDHFLIKKEYIINAKYNNICIKTNQKQLQPIVSQLNENILECSKNSYILLKEKKYINNNIIKIKYKLILYKNNTPINIKTKIFRCYKNNFNQYYEEYIIPELKRSIEEIKNY